MNIIKSNYKIIYQLLEIFTSDNCTIVRIREEISDWSSRPAGKYGCRLAAVATLLSHSMEVNRTIEKPSFIT